MDNTRAEGTGASTFAPNPLRDFVASIVEAAWVAFDDLTSIEEMRDEDTDETFTARCRAKVLDDLPAELDSYGLVAAYPEVIAAAGDVVRWWKDPKIPPEAKVVQPMRRLEAALASCAVAVVGDES